MPAATLPTSSVVRMVSESGSSASPTTPKTWRMPSSLCASKMTRATVRATGSADQTVKPSGSAACQSAAQVSGGSASNWPGSSHS